MFGMIGAQERTRTSTSLRILAPEASASTNSATWAGVEIRQIKSLPATVNGIIVAIREGVGACCYKFEIVSLVLNS